jgi:hypothetical protein
MRERERRPPRTPWPLTVLRPRTEPPPQPRVGWTGKKNRLLYKGALIFYFGKSNLFLHFRIVIGVLRQKTKHVVYIQPLYGGFCIFMSKNLLQAKFVFLKIGQYGC